TAPGPLRTCSTCSSLFLFSSSASHRALPSFPTRRSSDLTACGAYPPHATASAHGGLRCPRQGMANFARRAGGHAGSRGAFHVARSEEHTSELQSRENLVCRLLLEKKKNNATRASQT